MCTAGFGQRRALVPNGAVHVSPLQLGSTNSLNADGALKLLDAFYEAGGDFVDTANNYQEGLSEECIGEWAERRGIRERLVVATKYDASSNSEPLSESIAFSLEQSLKKLRTSYVDIFYVDALEWSISVEEVMDTLHDLVVSGKARYLGISNTPAWICSKANMYARAHGKTSFVIYQGSWDVFSPAFTQVVVPMARAEGMAIAPRGIAVTSIADDAAEKIDPHFGGDVIKKLEIVAKEVDVEASSVLLAYVFHKIPHVFPIIEASNIECLLANVGALKISLSSKQISYLESADRGLTRGEGTPEQVDPTAVAHAWLRDFAEAAASGDAHRFATKLFKPDGWFRDVLIFTWDNRTLHGHAKIVDYLEQRLAKVNITEVVLDETPALRPSSVPLPFGRVIEFSFRFETPIALGRGLARLMSTGSEMKALSVFVTMSDLKGHEESEAESGLYGGHTITWNEVLAERRADVENEPHVIIIGGGQCGLHVAARFKQMNISTLVVDKNQRIGDGWRKRYPSLTLHTPKTYSSTLYQPYPSNFPQYIPRDKIADWLENYATTQDLVLWTSSEVIKATYDSQEKRWAVKINQGGTTVTVHPKHVVVATGLHGFPYIPTIPHSETFRGEILHTSKFPGGQRFAGLRVVVIGAGNSSADICQDLSFRGAASVTMVQRTKTCVVSSNVIGDFLNQLYPEIPIEIPDFRKAGTPIGMARAMSRGLMEHARVVDRKMLEGLRKAGFQYHFGNDDAGPSLQFLSRGGGYWLDVGCAALIGSGKVAVRQGIEPVSFTDSGIVFNDGTELQADVVIFATGYTSWRDQLKDIFDKEVLESTKDIWGLDEEDELCGVYRPSGYPALWFAIGDFCESRISSKLLALHIKAEELNLKGGVE